MAKLTLSPIGSFSQTAISTINQNMDRIESALESTLSRDGTEPNQMTADLDMNHNDIINVADIHVDGESLYDSIEEIFDARDEAVAAANEAAADADSVEEALAEVTELLGGLADPVIQSYTVDETTTSVSLPVSDPLFTFVFNEGVFLTAGVDYTISGNTLSPVTAFTPARLTVLAMAALSLPISNINRKRYVSVSDYVPSNDTLSSVAGERAAFEAAYGRELVYDAPYGGTRYYRGTARGNGRVGTNVRKVRVIGAPGAIIDRSDYGTSGSQSRYFEHYADFETSTAALSGTPAKGDETITFVDSARAAAFTKGGYALICADDLLTGSATDYRSEWIQVAAISGSTITLASPLRDDYTTNPRTLRAIELCDVQYEDMKIIGAGKNVVDATSGDRGIWIGHGLNCGVDGGYIRYAQMQGVTLNSVINGYIRGVEITNDPSAFAGAQYPIALINNCENIVVSGNRISNGREGIALTDTGMPTPIGFVTGGGIPRDIYILNNTIRNQHRSGVTTHWAGRGLHIYKNFIQFCEQGFDIRIRGDTLIDYNVIQDTGTHAGNLHMAMQLSANAADVTFSHNKLIRCGRGVTMGADEVHIATPGNFKILDNEAEDLGRSVGGSLVEIHNTTGSTAECGTVDVCRNIVRGINSGTFVGVELEGNWQPTIVGNQYRNMIAGSRSAYLHATANGTGSNGSRNIVMHGDRYDNNFIDPAIVHQGTGLPVVYDNAPFNQSAASQYTLNAGGGIATSTVDFISIAARTGTTDDLDTIPLRSAGAILTLVPRSGDTITVRHIGGGTGNIKTKTAGSIILTVLQLFCDGVNWYEV